MKKVIIILSFGFIFLNAFEVQKNKTFEKDVEPTVMITSISAQIKDKDKLNIQNIFKEAIETSKLGNICTNGAYRISPSYEYIQNNYDRNSKRIFTGYNGNINFTCEFKDTKKLDLVISNLDKITKDDKLKITLNEISWTIDKKTNEDTIEELEIYALKYANTYSDFLTKLYKNTCGIKEIKLNAHNYSSPIPLVRSESIGFAKSHSTAPIKSDLTLKYSANYAFKCD